jgi:hypothetical protein
MKCEYCQHEHPENEIANPHYCIARLTEDLEKMQEESQGILAAKDAVLLDQSVLISKIQEEHRREIENITETLLFYKRESMEESKNITAKDKEIAAHISTNNALNAVAESRRMEILRQDEVIAALKIEAQTLHDKYGKLWDKNQRAVSSSLPFTAPFLSQPGGKRSGR